MKTDTSCVVNGSDLKSLLADAQIPALPTSAMRLLDLSKNPQCGIDEYALAIEADPSLSIQVLRFANSSYFGFAREISSVRHSLMLLGIRPIRNFVLWSAVYSLVPNPTFSGFDLKSLWQDSLRRAVFARTLGRATQLPTTEELFAAAVVAVFLAFLEIQTVDQAGDLAEFLLAAGGDGGAAGAARPVGEAGCGDLAVDAFGGDAAGSGVRADRPDGEPDHDQNGCRF